MIEIITRRAIQDILGYFSNPVGDFLLTYHSGFINGSETQYLASGGLEGQVQVATAAVIRNINTHIASANAWMAEGPSSRGDAITTP